jgi:type II secretory pathway pseudopilin PulG
MKASLKFNREGVKAQRFLKELSLLSRAVGGMNTFMNQSACFKRSNRRLLEPQNQSRAFTLTELLVVIGTIALLAMVVLPALAGVQNKGGRMQCANNLRQVGVATMIYAAEYKDMMPICTVGSFNAGGKFNYLGGMHYTRYVFDGTANSLVPTNATPPSSYYQNLGYLFRAGLAGNGSIFYCPEQWGTPLGANAYSPLLTTDSSGTVRSSYAFNPRIIDPTNGNNLRRYQKTSDLEPHKLFVVDYFANASFPPPSHFRERGWNVLFTDGSVQFSRNDQAYNLIQTTPIDESTPSQVGEDQIFNCLELDH